MKNQYRTACIVAAFISVVISSCSTTNSLTISVSNPPTVSVSSSVKTVGIVNRSLPSKGNIGIDKLDKILSLEGEALDKEGANQSIAGLYDELQSNSRFSEVKIIDNISVRSSGTSIFPAALSWETVESICRENKVDVIYVLSFYDTDTKVDYKAIPVKMGEVLGVKIPAIEHHAQMTTLIKMGWRMYDPANKLILDEYQRNETLTLSGVGINPLKALESILGRKDAVLEISNQMGHNYGQRILPYWIRVSRDYYVRGTNNFKIAKRRAQTGNWDGAAELWAKEVSNNKGKVAGRACYNMGIISEINGELDAAVDWTSKSYTDYKNKKALQYLNVLKRRVEKNRQLQEHYEE